MARDHREDIPAFYVTSQMWWASATTLDAGKLEEIMVGFYSPHGGTSGEFGFYWSMIESHPVMQLHCYVDGFSALARMPRLLQIMADHDGGRSHGPTPAEFIQQLKDAGYRDRTKRTPDAEDDYV